MFVGVAALITCACTSQGNVQEQTNAPTPDPLAVADQLLARGDYAAAAAAYVARASDLSGEAATHTTALAVLAFHDAGETQRATTLLATLPPGSEEREPLAALAVARERLQDGQPDAALALAQRAESASLSPYGRGVLARIVASVAAARSDFPTAAAAWLRAFLLPYPSAQQAAMTDSVWAALSHLPAAKVTEQVSANMADPATQGWYALAAIAQQSGFDPDTLRQKFDDWQQRYGNHPAVPLLASLLDRATAATARPQRLALILPFDESLGDAARAVRDGFMTAWFSDPNVQARPAVRIYANSGEDILADYRRAVGDGAQFIVGPLQKNLVERLQTLSELPVSVLALNVVENKSDVSAPHPGFYQFGLTPEDEANQVARRAYTDGGRALIIAPNSVWGTRLSSAYKRAWHDLGGTVLATVTYADSSDAYPSAVRRALNIDMSEARIAALRRTLGIALRADTRIRADVDAILLAGFPNNARQLLPQLRFLGAESIPVFSTSTVYNGSARADRDIDLNGLIFGDMPWLFGTVDVDSYRMVRRQWPGQVQAYSRLYGFGIDAYRILPFLTRMRARSSMRVPGVTGDLWMSADGVLHRNMSWIKFVEGVPTVIGGTSSIGPN